MPREPMDERFRDRMRRERSDLILRHTATLGAELGWDGFRVEDVAQRVGVAKGTIYLDFPDKENLVGAALSRCGAELLELLRQSVEPVRGAGAQMSAALRFLAALVVDHPELSAYLRSAMSSRSSPSLGEVLRYVRKLVEAAQASQEMPRDVDPELAAEVVLAASCVPASFRIATKRGPDQLVTELSALLRSLASA